MLTRTHTHTHARTHMAPGDAFYVVEDGSLTIFREPGNQALLTCQLPSCLVELARRSLQPTLGAAWVQRAVWACTRATHTIKNKRNHRSSRASARAHALASSRCCARCVCMCVCVRVWVCVCVCVCVRARARVHFMAL